MRRMQAAGIDAFGGDVHVLELPTPGTPAPDEVVISVHAAGVGNWDEIVRVGDWEVGPRPPLALGVEAAGVVVAAGDDVSSLAPGDEVLTHPVPLRHQGTWAELLVAPATLVVRKSAAVSWETAAALPGKNPCGRTGPGGPLDGNVRMNRLVESTGSVFTFS